MTWDAMPCQLMLLYNNIWGQQMGLCCIDPVRHVSVTERIVDLTCCTSAPVASHSAEMELMEEIL